MPELHTRLLANVIALGSPYPLVLTGGYARTSMSPPRTRYPWPMAALVGTPGVRRLRAGHLITPPHEDARKLGEFGAALADVLARHVEVTGIDDEATFFSTFEDEIRKARPSVWLWAPWVANRVRGILPLLHEAAGRGVRVTVFIRDDRTSSRPARTARASSPTCGPSSTRSSPVTSCTRRSR
ncbi:hypothetical protein ACWCQZ_35055 [Streptomyces sp. NPDC002285]